MSTDALLGFFHSQCEEGTPLAVFQVYCDESGKLADSACVSFASIVFNQEEALPFCNRWNAILSGENIKYLTMKEAMHFQGEFKGWKDRASDRDGLLEALASLAWDRCAFLVSSPMITDGFRSLPQLQQQRLRDLPYAAFETLIAGIAELAKKSGPRDRFHLVYDLSEEYSIECVKLFNRLRRMRGLNRDLFASLSFADDIDFPPLQAADMYAYCERQRAMEKDESAPIIKRLGEILRKGKNTGDRDLVYRSQKGLGHGVLELPIQ